MIPADTIVLAAARQVHASRRLELGLLARSLGISRVTLHRRVGNREQLLGEALWFLTRRTFELGVQRWDEACAYGGVTEGAVRSLWILREFRELVAEDRGLLHLLTEEPAMAIRLLTDPRGRVQPRIIDAQAGLLREDVEAGTIRPTVDVTVLSHAVARLGESFLYVDVIASRSPDLLACGALIDAIVLAEQPREVAPAG